MSSFAIWPRKRVQTFSQTPKTLVAVRAVPARLVSQFADSSRVRVLEAPRELGAVQFHDVWHPRVNEDPSHLWLRGIVLDVAAGTPPKK